MNTQLDLLNWSPPVQIIAFPLDKQVGRVREVAQKLTGKTSRQAEHYLWQVTGGMFARLSRIGTPPGEQHEMVRSFIEAVEAEATRLSSLRCGSGGAA